MTDLGSWWTSNKVFYVWRNIAHYGSSPRRMQPKDGVEPNGIVSASCVKCQARPAFARRLGIGRCRDNGAIPAHGVFGILRSSQTQLRGAGELAPLAYRFRPLFNGLQVRS
jgi:hypothetical protein